MVSMNTAPSVLVICPSRGRPKECRRMLESFHATQKISMIRVCLDMCDPCLNDYMDICTPLAPLLIDQRKKTTEIINGNWRYAPEHIKYFSITNDDFVYRTDSWDLKLVGEIALNGGKGIAYGNDLCAGANLPTTSVISRTIVEALGWLQMPTLTHLYGDNVWKHIGQSAGCLYHRQDVIIEHMHVFNKKMAPDATHQHTNSQGMYAKDEAAFAEWITLQAKTDIAKVKGILCPR